MTGKQKRTTPFGKKYFSLLHGLGVGPGSVTERWPLKREKHAKICFFGRKYIKIKYFFQVIFFSPEKKVIFARFFGTASVQSRSLDQPLVHGVFVMESMFALQLVGREVAAPGFLEKNCF